MNAKIGDIVKLPYKHSTIKLLTPEVLEVAKKLKEGEGILLADFTKHRNSISSRQAWMNVWLIKHEYSHLRVVIRKYCLYLVLNTNGAK
jgi:hypothetical protein